MIAHRDTGVLAYWRAVVRQVKANRYLVESVIIDRKSNVTSLGQGWKHFSVKGQVDILELMSHISLC